jgi:hypothetical protein
MSVDGANEGPRWAGFVTLRKPRGHADFCTLDMCEDMTYFPGHDAEALVWSLVAVAHGDFIEPIMKRRRLTFAPEGVAWQPTCPREVATALRNLVVLVVIKSTRPVLTTTIVRRAFGLGLPDTSSDALVDACEWSEG